MRYSTLFLLNDSSNSLKSVRISIILASEGIDRRETFLRRAAEPILKVLPDLRRIIQVLFLYRLTNHDLSFSN